MYPQRAMRPLAERFWEKVDRSGDCWLWLAGHNGSGYGLIGLGRRGQGKGLAHRLAYEMLVGPIPPGSEIDHLCRNPACVNPAHLQPVTHRENILRSPTAPPAIHARQTRCIHGHPLSGENLRIWIRPDGAKRRLCLTCERRRWAATSKRRRKC